MSRLLGAPEPGSELPLGDLPQDLAVHLLGRHQMPRPGVLLLHFVQPRDRVQVLRPVFAQPAWQRHLWHSGRLRHLGDRRSPRHGAFSMPQVRAYLRRKMLPSVLVLHLRLPRLFGP